MRLLLRESWSGIRGEGLVAVLLLSLFIATYVALEVEDTFISPPNRASAAALFSFLSRLSLADMMIKAAKKDTMKMANPIVTISPDVVRSSCLFMHTVLSEELVVQILPEAQLEAVDTN